jgi:hypothetical protein
VKTPVRFILLLLLQVTLAQFTCAAVYADVYERAIWKSHDEKNLEYASLRTSVAHFTDGFFPKEKLMLRYCSDWLGENKNRKADDGNSEFLLRFDRGVAGGLSVKSNGNNRETVEKRGQLLASDFKKKVEAEGGKVTETKVTPKKWYQLDGLRIERSFSYPDVAEKISSVAQLWWDGNKEYCIEIAAPESWFKNNVYAKMINVTLDSVAPLNPYTYEHATRKNQSSSSQKPRVDKSAAPAINIDEIISGLESHYDSERELRIKCPKDAVWKPRYDRIRFSTRDVTAFEHKTDLYNIELTSSWQYLGETLDSAIGEIKSELPASYWEVVSCEDVRISGVPAKKLVIRIDYGDPKKPVEIRTSYLVLVNSLIYNLRLSTREALAEKMSKVIDTMATSMEVGW